MICCVCLWFGRIGISVLFYFCLMWLAWLCRTRAAPWWSTDPRVLSSHPRQCTDSSPRPAAGWPLRNSPCATLGPAPVPECLLETRPCMWTGSKVCHLELSLHFLLHISLSDIYICTHIYKYADFPLHKVNKCYITSKRGFTMGESLHSKCLLTTANQFHERFVL